MGQAKGNPSAGGAGAWKDVRISTTNTSENKPTDNNLQEPEASRAATPSNIIKLGRVYQPRLEVAHCYSFPMQVSVFRLEHVGERSRRFVGEFHEVRAAFEVARAYRNQGIRVGCVDRVLP
jgi:hypothetical protein